MSDEDKKPRYFTLEFFYDETKPLKIRLNVKLNVLFGESEWEIPAGAPNPYLVKTIEYSAFEAMRDERDKLKKVVKWNLQNNDEFGCEFLGITIVRDENKKLKERIEKLREALGKCKTNSVSPAALIHDTKIDLALKQDEEMK